MRSLLDWTAKTMYNDYVFGRVLQAARKKSVYEYWKWCHDRDEYCKLFYREVRGVIARIHAAGATAQHAHQFALADKSAMSARSGTNSSWTAL